MSIRTRKRYHCLFYAATKYIFYCVKLKFVSQWTLIRADALCSLFNAETAAYRQLLNATGSSGNLTALLPGDVDSDDDIEKNIVPRKPGPSSSPQQPAAAAAAASSAVDARRNSREIPRQQVTDLPAASAASKSAKNTYSKERFVPFQYVTCCLSIFVFVD